MLKTILSISGKSGLFRLLSQTRSSLIVESLSDSKRLPVYASDRVVSLADISIFTEEGDVPLSDVLEKIKSAHGSQEIDLAPFKDKKDYWTFFEEVLPQFDKERVYPTDIKKILVWYNLLIKNQITSFKEEEA